ncbi:MAG: alpha-ribazole phosphatase [Verrucomicrobia bacterium]|nr:alpha-ribazole phosphatase [Cytophagales bacterium]
MEVFVIRHTQVSIGKNSCYGQAEVPLADSFEEETLLLKTQLPQNATIFSSPSKRCTDLASRLTTEKIIEDDRLKEMNFGAWELQAWNSIEPEILNAWMQDFVNIAPPKGENLKIMYARVEAFLNDLKNHDYNQIIIVTHAGVIRCIWAYILQIPLQNIFKIPVAYGEVFTFNLNSEEATTVITRKK